MIVIHPAEVEYIKERAQKALDTGRSMVMLYVDRVQIATILGLIERYEAMTKGEEYKLGYAKGFDVAKDMAIQAVGGLKTNAGT